MLHISRQGAWDAAREEILRRREREREAGEKFVEEAEKRRHREGSGAVREAATKKLDKDVAGDWDYQVGVFSSLLGVT